MNIPTRKELLEAANVFEFKGQLRCESAARFADQGEDKLAAESRLEAKQYIQAATALHQWARRIPSILGRPVLPTPKRLGGKRGAT